jgi:hypothetical protein
MPKHYVYRIDHDTGFAPNVDYGMCTLCGCKINSIESWAEPGSWVIGIGGNRTGKPNKLIYAMEAEKALPYDEFTKRYKRKGAYLRKSAYLRRYRRKRRVLPNVLLSRTFYYFGDQACDLPHELQPIVIHGRGCKLVSDEDIARLRKYLSKYPHGKHGRPNNQQRLAQTRC